MEIWKPIKGYECVYEVSSLGNIRSVDRTRSHGKNMPDKKRVIKGRIIKQQLNSGTRTGVKPRYQVGLSLNGKVKSHQVHRLVAEAFLGETNGLEVNHKDGNPLNNTLVNIELVTREENIKHAFENKLINTSKSVVKLDPETLEEIEEYYSEAEACRCNGTYQNRISTAIAKNVVRCGYKWKWKTKPVETIESMQKHKRVE
jgi:hypothetical protein